MQANSINGFFPKSSFFLLVETLVFIVQIRLNLLIVRMILYIFIRISIYKQRDIYCERKTI